MRRTRTILLAAFLMLVASVPAGAQDNYIEIALPSYLPVDGQIDLVVLTGDQQGTMQVGEFCFSQGEGSYPLYRATIIDHSAGGHGSVTGMIATRDVKGVRLVDVVNQGVCWVDGQEYSLYYGFYEPAK